MNMLALARRALVAIAAVLLVMIVQPGAASAHTDFDFSLPTDGASVGSPVDEVTVAFTSPVELIGNGFETLDPQGNVLEPFAVTDDDQVFRLQFDPPLAGGAVGVRYEVRADDGHVLAGSFSFIVDAPVPIAPPVTSSPTTTSPAPAATAPTTPTPTTSAVDDGAAAAGNEPTTTVASGPVTTADAAEGESDDGSNTAVIVVIVAALAVGAAGFFLIRSRTSATP